MFNRALDKEFKLAESMARNIQKKIRTHYLESGISGEYVKAEVLVPMTENVNMIFEIDVPYKMMDEDNTSLLEYFVHHIYKPENNLYMTEAVDSLVIQKEKDFKILKENLDNFDADAFMRGDYDPFNEYDGNAPRSVSTTMHGDYDGDLLDTPIDRFDEDDETFTEMATVARDEERQLRIQINPDRDRIGNPYFKVFNTATPKKKVSRVARFHFKDEDMEYYNDNFLDWVISKNDIKQIKSFLMEPHYLTPQYTNWKMACYLWNYEYGFIGDPEKYFNGEEEEKNKDHTSYVPHDQEMPETWDYNPPQNKNKRK